jgi:GH24 family phage-related lysozyme (muramidase)
MTTKTEALALVRGDLEETEGLRTEAYLCQGRVWTIGIGMTYYPGGLPVREGDVTSEAVARSMLEQLLLQDFAPGCERIPGWSRFGMYRQAALLSFAYNMGAGFYGAKHFETITRVLKEGAENPAAYREMRSALSLYNRADGEVSEGLINRRAHEADLWDMENNDVITFKAVHETYLKAAPIAQDLLSDKGKQYVPVGTVLTLDRLEEIPRDSHAWVALGGSKRPWALFMPHWTQAAIAGAAPAAGTEPDWSSFGAKVSKHFTVGEVLQYDARRRPIRGSAEVKAILELAAHLDRLRDSWGGPIGVTSWYRPEPINRQVGGVPNSFHTRGMAADIYPLDGEMDRFHAWLIKRWSGGLGDGRNKGFIHVDTEGGGGFSARGGVRPKRTWLY